MSKFDNYTDNSHYYRGKLINTFASLEKAVELYIAAYIIRGGYVYIDIYTIVLDRMSFEAKRTAFKTILDRISESQGFVKTKSKPYPSGKFIDDLRRLNDERNYFAHYLLARKDQETCENSIINLTEFRDSKKVISYTKDKYDEIIKKMEDTNVKVFNMAMDLSTRTPR